MTRQRRFGEWRFNADTDEVTSGSKSVTLEPRVARLLEYFLEHPGELLSHDRLVEAVWDGRVVSDEAVRRCVSSLRQALATDGQAGFIRTIHKKGYVAEFPAPAPARGPPPEPAAPAAASKRISMSLVLVLVLALAGAGLFWLDRVAAPPSAGTAEGTVREVTVTAPPSVAVLPFSTLAEDDPQGAYFADGMLSEIVTHLYKIDDLETIGRASVIRFRGAEVPIRRIGEELGVEAVLTGSLVRAADRIRLDVQLLEPETGRVLWAEGYDRPLEVEELFDIQTDIALQIAKALDATLSPVEHQRLARGRTTTNVVAYDHFLRGEGYEQREALPEAMSAYERAVKADPEFAAAWAGLARVAALAFWLPWLDSPEEPPKEALAQARRLAPDAPETLLAEGMYRLFVSGDYAGAIHKFSLAFEERKSAVVPRYYLAVAHTLLLNLDKAKEYARDAVALDPLYPRTVNQLAFIHSEMWSFEAARRYYERAIALGADGSLSYTHLWDVLVWGFHDIVKARRLLESFPAEAPTAGRRLWLAYVERDPQAMTSLLESVELPSSNRHQWLARLARLNGDVEAQRRHGRSMVSALEAVTDRAEDLAVVFREAHRSNVAVALALAGEKEAAIATIRHATERVAAQPDRLNQVVVYYNAVRTYAFLGQREAAVNELRSLLSWRRSRILTPARLRLDPDFDSLRGYPAFDALLDELTVSLDREAAPHASTRRGDAQSRLPNSAATT